MALGKVENSNLGKFGSLTSTGRATADKSIFGSNGCCSYKDSFSTLSAGDSGMFDVCSSSGMANIQREMDIIKGTNSAKPQHVQKTFEMNTKALMMMKNEFLNMNKSFNTNTLC
ncbi:hypothetical protein IJG14_08480 [bacterium]|nr:hypothetical protein [bacterium]